MTFWIMLGAFVVLLPMVCFHRWHRPSDDWRERECLKCGQVQYLHAREWVIFRRVDRTGVKP